MCSNYSVVTVNKAELSNWTTASEKMSRISIACEAAIANHLETSSAGGCSTPKLVAALRVLDYKEPLRLVPLLVVTHYTRTCVWLDSGQPCQP